MTGPDDTARRDAALRAILPLVPRLGWTSRAFAEGLRAAGLPGEEAAILFPRGAVSAIEGWFAWLDREMVVEAGDLSALRTAPRLRALVATRFRLLAPHKEALRQAVAILALPWNAAAGLRSAARRADAFWNAAGDRSADLSRHTRRATLAVVHAATLAYWLRDGSADPAAAMAFLDRRLAGLARLQACRMRRRDKLAA